MSAADEYNFSHFDVARDEAAFAGFLDTVHVGERAPNAAVEDLATGEMIELRSLWRRNMAIVEFGSFT